MGSFTVASGKFGDAYCQCFGGLPYMRAGLAWGWSKSGSIAAPAVMSMVEKAMLGARFIAVLMMAPAARPLVAWVTPFITMIPFQSVKVVAYLTVAGIGCGKQIFLLQLAQC